MKQTLQIALFLFSILLLTGNCLAATQHEGKAIAGVWQTKSGGYVQIYHTSNGWYGRVVGSSNGQARFDTHNPDKSKRKRRLLGQTLLKHLRYEEDHKYDDGTIYDPQNGKTYSLNAELIDFNTLHVRGYVGFSLFGKTQTWHRISPGARYVRKRLLSQPVPPGPSKEPKQGANNT